jgi:hypothetical protein
MLDLTPRSDHRAALFRFLASLAGAICLLAAAAAFASDSPHPPWRRPLSDAALIALFERVLALSPADAVNCLAWDGADAPPAVLKALQSSARHVVPASACRPQAQPPGSYERDTRQPAQLDELGPFEPSSSGRAVVPFHSYRNGLWGSKGRCHLTAEGEDWHVERCDVEIVS